MATDGSEEWVDELDIDSLITDIENLDTSTKLESKDCSLNWEDTKADQLYEDITEDSFHGFPTSTPRKSAQSDSTVKEKIKSFEKLSKKTGTIRKTRAATGKGIASPPKPPGDFLRRRKSNKELDLAKPVKRLLTKRKSTEPIKVSRKGIARSIPKVQKLRTMAQPEIPRAGRLNPRGRRAGGLGESVEDLHFPNLATAGISPSGKLTMRKLVILRETIVANSNIVMVQGRNIQTAIKPLQKYLLRVKEIYTSFQNTPADIADGNINGLAVMNELITLEDEIEGLNEYCEEQLAGIPPADPAAAGAGQIRLARISLPTFDGESNYNNWKTDFDELIVHVEDSMKRARLMESLKGDAESYIKSVYTPLKTYADIISLLAARYNDPLVVNYNLLDKLFNSPDMAKPQSTEKHWDRAIGDINAVMASGMAMDEIMLYYKLHKFQPETISKVKMMHKIKYPGRPSINVEEAVDLMNKVIAEEVELKKDSVALEQTMQGLTMTVVPRSSQVAAPAAAPISQTPSTMTPAIHQNTLTNQNAVAQTSQPQKTSKKQSKNNRGGTCTLCGGGGHTASECQTYPSPKSKINRLTRVGGCYNCAGYYGDCKVYGCEAVNKCKKCGKYHYEWLSKNCTTT